MRKLFLISIAWMLAMTIMPVMATGGDNPIPLNMKIKQTNPESELTPLPKAPILIPAVYLDGHTLSFDAAIEGCEVRLLDEDENVIFSDFIAISQTSLILPATLSGTYELQIIRGNFIFYCEIEL